VTDSQGWNDGQLGRTQRQKDALLKRIRFQDGHWVWTGEFNFAGSPIVRHGGDAVSAAEAVYAVWERRARPWPRRDCKVPACVNPGCLTPGP
jgi:hypothetical protein